jgi:hypothetical protein
MVVKTKLMTSKLVAKPLNKVSAGSCVVEFEIVGKHIVDAIEVNGKASLRNVDESIVDDVKVGVESPGHNSTKALKIVSSNFR